MTTTRDHIALISRDLSLEPRQVRATARLLEGGATVPFIARYRKEASGGLDEVAIAAVRDELAAHAALDKRRAVILKSLSDRDLLTDELRDGVEAADTLATLEDLYLPLRPKRRTRATMAREKGLEPLAETILAQNAGDVRAAAAGFVSDTAGVASVEEALAGARDIIAEWVSEDAGARSEMRRLFEREAVLSARLVARREREAQKYRDYFDWQEPIASAPSHRVLAVLRGENEKLLTVHVRPREEAALALLERAFVKADNSAGAQVQMAVRDGYKRLLGPSMETEARRAAKERADADAIQVFSENLRQLLLAPPLGPMTVMAVDPGFRTGCKVVCLDPQGKLLRDDVIHPHSGAAKAEDAASTVRKLCLKHGVEAVAVGDGTAGRETVAFMEGLDLPGAPPVVGVNESGASIYSASEAARDEFPDHDVTVRGAVSIGRRLQDPLAELVKIDPKSIGVGQYQHDVDQAAIRSALDDVVESCVNSVGAEVNTASVQLLTYVSGLGPTLAHSIVEARDSKGPFTTRKDLLGVPRLGPKAFEQCAGFLRIADGASPLDASAVHPESYPVVERMARDLASDVGGLMRDQDLRARIRLDDYVSDTIGLPTLKDIVSELAKPGRDPRESFEVFRYAEGVHEMGDLEPGMRLPGKVTNITRFGAFVDVGVHQDGLVHISQMADRYVKDPGEVVKLGQIVTVTVLDVDLERRRISLSLRSS